MKAGNPSESNNTPEKAQKSAGEDKLGLIVGMASDGSGVQIQAVEQNSPADDAGLRGGGIIRRIKDDAIKFVTDYKKIIKIRNQNRIFSSIFNAVILNHLLW